MFDKVNLRRISVRFFAAAIALTLFSVLATAQSPNTAALVVTVVDQNEAIVPGANIQVTNLSTGAVRDTMSGAEGSVTISALSLNGKYKISVSKSGFTADEVSDLMFRSGET